MQQEHFFLIWLCNQFDPLLLLLIFSKMTTLIFLFGEICQKHVPTPRDGHEDIAVHYGNEIGPSDQQFEVNHLTEKSAMKIKNIGELSLLIVGGCTDIGTLSIKIIFSKSVEKNSKNVKKLYTKLEHVRREVDRCVLEHTYVIGMTTTGAARYQRILNLVKPKIVIIEEAAEILVSHIVSALNAGTQHLVLIGDHKQLRPKPNVYNLSKKYRLDVSLFERLILNNHPHVTLTIQHRMRPEIAQLVKPHIYDILLNHSSVENYPNIRGVNTNLYFISHDKPEHTVTHLLSHSNDHVAKYLVAFCQYLLQQNYAPNQITILVTYSGQLLTKRELMPKRSFNGVWLSTVDNFQGEENTSFFCLL